LAIISSNFLKDIEGDRVLGAQGVEKVRRFERSGPGISAILTPRTAAIAAEIIAATSDIPHDYRRTQCRT
jgi:hypothetical protein